MESNSRSFTWRGLCLMIAMLLMTCGSAVAAVIKGTVTSKTDGEPLIGASIVVKGSKIAAPTDFDGHFTVSAEIGQTLVVSYVGFNTSEVRITSAEMAIELTENTSVLDEVVVVGYGTMKRSDITGSTVSMSGDEIKKTGALSLDQALQGKAAGVQVTTNSGTPGGGISVAIRGTNSLNGNEPLYVIDGVAVEGQTNNNTSALASINPADIVNMEVLKDASATAIYGSRASNGVVIITTRRGEANSTKVSYEGYVAWQSLPKKIDVLDLSQYAAFYNDRAEILGYGEREEFRNPAILGAGTNWQDEIFRTALMHNHQVSLSGGSDKIRYAVSGSYLDQDGIVLGSAFERFTGRVNLDVDVAKWLKFGVNSSLATRRQDNSIEGSVNMMDNNVLMLAVRQYPEVPVRNADGTFGYVDKSKIDTGGTPLSNPVSDALTRERYTKGTDVFINGFLDIIPYKDLTIRLEYGRSLSYSKDYYFVPFYDFGTYTQQSEGSRSSSQSDYMSFKTYATYTHTWNDVHSFNAMLGHEAQSSRWENLNGSRTGYKFNSVHELPSGDSSTAKNSSAVSETAIESYFGRVNYGFDSRYLLTATLRADGSSAFGPNNRWGWFPSVALAWRISNEKFMESTGTWLNNLKLRLGWGLVGNQNAGSYAYGAPISTVSTVWGTGYYQSRFSNSDLKWEQTKSWNAGVDIAVLNNRIEFIFDAYYKKTDNLLMDAPLPSYVTGGSTPDQSIISAPWINVGAMENKGFEFTLNTTPIANRDFTWSSNLTFSLNRNKITKLYTESSSINGILGNQIHTMSTVGNPVGQFYGYVLDGMFNTAEDFYMKDKNGNYMYDASGNRRYVAIPEGKTIKEGEIWLGDYKWKDLNGDGVINEQDRTYIGNPEPKFSFGWTNSFTYKDFDLSFFFTGAIGGKVYNYIDELNANPYNMTGQLVKNADFARLGLYDPEAGRTLDNMYVINAGQAKVQRVTASDANTNNRVSDRFVEDGSYVRLKNLSIGYSLPQSLLSRLNISQLRVYATFQNLFTITGYKGYDPEIGAYNQDVKLRGIDFARYPSQRIYTVGLSISY